MKMFLKTTLFAAALFGCVNFATAQIDFGVKAGLNLANISFSNFDVEPDTKMLINFQAGVIADINISDNLAIQPGLLLVGKGFKVEEEFLGETFKTTANPMYLQVPVNVLYKGNMFYAGVGPYVGLGLFGKAKYEDSTGSESEDLTFGNDEADHFAPLDFGANIEAGVMLNNIRIGAGYALGLANIIPEGARSDNESAKHGVISVNVAYMFGSKE